MGRKLNVVRVNSSTGAVARRSYIASGRFNDEEYVRNMVMPHFGDEEAKFKRLLSEEVEEGETPRASLGNGEIVYTFYSTKLKKLVRPGMKHLPEARFKAERFFGDIGRLFGEITSNEGPVEETMGTKIELTEFGHTFDDSAVPFTINATKLPDSSDFAITFEVHGTVATESSLLDLAYSLGRMERIVKKIWRLRQTFHGKLEANHGY